MGRIGREQTPRERKGSWGVESFHFGGDVGGLFSEKGKGELPINRGDQGRLRQLSPRGRP